MSGFFGKKQKNQTTMKTKTIKRNRYKCPETRTVIDRKQVLKHLSSDKLEFELNEDRGVVTLNDYSEFNEERCVILELTVDFFNKDTYYQPRWSNGDPTDVLCYENFNICELHKLDFDWRDEWDISDIHEVFSKNIDDIEIIID
jgi:hypothetical protein